MSKSKINVHNLRQYILLFLGIVMFVLDSRGILKFARYPLSYVFEPIAFSAENAGKTVGKWGQALTNASSYIYELDILKEELAKAKGTNSSILIIQEENVALRKQAAVTNENDVYVLGKVLSYSSEGSIHINIGEKDGVEEGDVVSLGDFFIGVVSQVDWTGSSVRIPINKSSHYEIAVLEPSANLENSIDGLIKATGVVSGSSSGIKLENIGINAEVKDGDLVVLRDERIGRILALGSVVGLVSNPASTSKSGFISPIYDYANLITVFVKTN